MGLRSLIYRWGFRPKPGSIFFSPSLDLHYKMLGAMKAFAGGFRSAFLTANQTRAVFLDSSGDKIHTNSCKVCGKVDWENPIVFRGTHWCCEIHRKVFVGETPMDDPVNLDVLAGEP